MELGQNGLKLIKQWEGFVDHAYHGELDPPNIWTMGYGSTFWNGQPVVPGMTCTEAEAAEQLRMTCQQRYGAAVNRLITVPLNQNQFDALVSFTYNLGEGALEQSTLRRILNAGDYAGVPAQLLRWNMADGHPVQGLTNRRTAEGVLWNTPI